MWKLTFAIIVLILWVNDSSHATVMFWNNTSGNNWWTINTNWDLIGGGHPDTEGPYVGDTAILPSVCPPSYVLTEEAGLVSNVILGDGSDTYPGPCEIGAELVLIGALDILGFFRGDQYTSIIFPDDVGGYLQAEFNLSIGSNIIATCPSDSWAGIVSNAHSVEFNGTVNVTDCTFHIGALWQITFLENSILNFMAGSNVVLRNEFPMLASFLSPLNLFGPCSLTVQAPNLASTVVAEMMVYSSTSLSTDVVVIGSGLHSAIDIWTWSGGLTMLNGIMSIRTHSFSLTGTLDMCETCTLEFANSHDGSASVNVSNIVFGGNYRVVDLANCVFDAFTFGANFNVTGSNSVLTHYGSAFVAVITVSGPGSHFYGIYTAVSFVLLSGMSYFYGPCLSSTITLLGGNATIVSGTCTL